MSTPIILRYLATSSHITSLALSKSANGSVHLIGADKSIDKLVMSRVLGEGICNIGSFLTSNFTLYSPRYDGRVLKDLALLS